MSEGIIEEVVAVPEHLVEKLVGKLCARACVSDVSRRGSMIG